MQYRWNVPEEIKKEVSVVDLTDETLYFYHDQMHIFWKKIEEGMVFGWTFNEAFLMHKKIVIEMLKRKLKHLSPINILDKIAFVGSKKELAKVINYITKR